jgi:Domain of unknown function (DUF1963)
MLVPGQVDVGRELRRALGPPAARAVLPLVAPAVMLVDDADGTSIANPRPRLPHGAAWPFWQGQPMALLLDLDLAAVQRVVADPLLPADGRLLVFADAGREEPIPGGWGVDCAGSGVLLHVPPGTPTSLVEAPGKLELDAVRLAARPGWSLPALERRVRTALAGDDDAVWAYHKLHLAMSAAYPLRWGQVFGEVEEHHANMRFVGDLAAAVWPDWPGNPCRWLPALTVATELDDNAELTFWLCADAGLPERLDRPWMTLFSG